MILDDEKIRCARGCSGWEFGLDCNYWSGDANEWIESLGLWREVGGLENGWKWC